MSETVVKNFIVYSILNANRGREPYSRILEFDWIYSHVLDELNKTAPAIQNRYTMYGLSAEASTTPCFGHTRHGGRPDQILGRLAIYKTYVKYVMELYLEMKKVGLVTSSISDKNVYPEIESILDWCKSSNLINEDARLDGIFGFLIAVKEAKKDGVKEKRLTIPVKWLPQTEEDAAGAIGRAALGPADVTPEDFRRLALRIFEDLDDFLSFGNGQFRKKYNVKEVIYPDNLNLKRINSGNQEDFINDNLNNIENDNVIEIKIILE